MGRSPASTPPQQRATTLDLWLQAGVGVTTGATFTWADQLGNGKNATQSTSSNQPTQQTNQLNGNPVIRLDGGDFLSIASYQLFATTSSPAMLYLVSDATANEGTSNQMYLMAEDFTNCTKGDGERLSLI